MGVFQIRGMGGCLFVILYGTVETTQESWWPMIAGMSPGKFALRFSQPWRAAGKSPNQMEFIAGKSSINGEVSS
jgi:hypothetical protein